MVLELHEIISGFFSLGLIISFILIGLTISLKYFKHRNRTLLFMGLFWICLSQAWWSSFINVFLIFTNINEQGLSPELYFLLTLTLIPFTGFFYISAMTDLIYNKYQKHFQVIEIVITVSFEIFCICNLIINPSLIITKTSPTLIVYSIYLISGILGLSSVILIFGFLLSIEALKSDEREMKLKGKILIIAFILFLIGGIMDTIEFTTLLDFLDRIILILSAILFYIGFILPDWI